MTKKLISYDDQKPGLGLPAPVADRMGHTFVQAPIDLSGRGMSHLKTGAENYTIAVEAIAEAEGTGRQIIFPHCPTDTWIDIEGPLEVKTGGMSIVGHGVGKTKLRQTRRMTPLFDLWGPDVEIGGFTGMQTTGWPTAEERAYWRGQPGTGKLNLVRVHGDRTHVHDVYGVDASSVVGFSAWDVVEGAPGAPLRGCSARNIHSQDCVFGLLVVGVTDFFFENITGNYMLRPGWTTPPHLLYFSDGMGVNTDVRGGYCQATNGIDGHAFQLKAIHGGEITSLQARGCSGLLNVMQCHDLTISDLRSMDDTYTGTNYGSITADIDIRRVTLRDIYIAMSGNGKPLRLVTDIEDVHIENLRVVSNHTDSPDVGAYGYDVDLSGTTVTAKSVSVENVGPTAWGAGIGIFTGSGHKIVRPSTKGNTFGVLVRAPVTGTLIEDYYLPEVSGTNRSIDLTGPATLFPRHSVALAAYDRMPVLLDDGTTTSGTFGLVRHPQVGPEWQQLVGEWRAETSGLIFQNHELNSTLLVAPIDQADVTVSADVQYGDREGLAVRAADRGNVLIGRPNHVTGVLEIVKRSESIETVLASVPFSPTVGSSYRLKFDALGDRLRLTVNGDMLEVEHVLSPEDMSLFPSTSHGLFAARYATGGGYRNIAMY